MSARLYLEGGGTSKELHSRCREGFRKLLESAGFSGRMPRLIACGSRTETFGDFKTAHALGRPSFVAMLIDSEDPMLSLEQTWDHLRRRDHWERPDGATDDQVLFMTTCMETWIVADRPTLRRHYHPDLQETALPPLDNLEKRDRKQIQDKLAHATRNCSNAYIKGERSFETLGQLRPDELKKHLPSFVRVTRILDEKL